MGYANEGEHDDAAHRWARAVSAHLASPQPQTMPLSSILLARVRPRRAAADTKACLVRAAPVCADSRSTTARVNVGVVPRLLSLLPFRYCNFPAARSAALANFAGEGRGYEHSRVSFAAASSGPAAYPTNSIALSRFRSESRRHSNSDRVNFTTSHQ